VGCDIHAFVEFKKYDSYWSLTHGQLNILRDDSLFSALAFGGGGITDDLPYPPRGIAPGLSWDAKNFFYSPAKDVQDFTEEHFPDEDDEKFDPEKYASEFGEAALEEFRKYDLLPAVELHSHSWLNLPELKEALAHAHLATDKLSPEFRAVLAAMEMLAESYGGANVRLVFCFDG